MKKKILVADDDPGIRDIFKIIFEKAGYNIEIKDDAEDVLKNNFTIPDIFLIDKLLSGYDGLDICRYLKSNPLTCHIPVIMVSASPDIGITAMKAGADDFVEKPFDLKYLLKVIERNISRAKNEKQTITVRNLQD
jgi:DNA-binding response OmpR family regulator